MSVFDDNNDDVKKSVRFFNHLNDEEKVRIISDLSPNVFRQKRQYRPLVPLLSKIQKDISKHDAIVIGTKLIEYGLDETYARLFVSNVKKHAPTTEYHLNQISRIPEEEFCAKLPDIMKECFVDREDSDVLSERHGIEKERLECVVALVQEAFMGLLRGYATRERLRSGYIKHISRKKADALLEQISMHLDYQRQTITFSDLQEIYLNAEQIVQQNNDILKLLRRLVADKKNESKN